MEKHQAALGNFTSVSFVVLENTIITPFDITFTQKNNYYALVNPTSLVSVRN